MPTKVRKLCYVFVYCECCVIIIVSEISIKSVTIIYRGFHFSFRFIVLGWEVLRDISLFHILSCHRIGPRVSECGVKRPALPSFSQAF